MSRCFGINNDSSENKNRIRVKFRLNRCLLTAFRPARATGVDGGAVGEKCGAIQAQVDLVPVAGFVRPLRTSSTRTTVQVLTLGTTCSVRAYPNSGFQESWP